MGAAIDGADGRGKKRPLDAQLNLVPFIDLLVCCICFLLITAVWSRMAHLPTDKASPGPTSEALPDASRKVALLIDADGYRLSVGAERRFVEKQADSYDRGELARYLTELQGRSPRQGLTILVADDVDYRHVVDAMEVARAASFARLHVTDAQERI